MNQTSGAAKKILPAVKRFFLKIGSFIRRHKKPFIFLAVLAGLAIAALLLLPRFFKGATATGFSMPETTILAPMDLELVVTATGTLQSADVRQVNSSLSYEIAEIYFDVGDTVAAGDVLCLLDSSDLDDEIADLRADIAKAGEEDADALEKLAQKIQEASDDRTANHAKNEASVTSTYTALTNAQAALPSAEEALTTARSELESRIDSHLTEEGRAAGAQTLIRSENDLAYYYSQYPAPLDESASASTASDPQSSWFIGGQQEVASDLSIYLSRYSEAENALSAAQSAVSSAQSAYDKAIETRDTAYASDTKAIETAQDNYNEQAKKDSAEDLRKQLEDLLEDKDDLSVTAPVSGTITAMTAEVGKSAGSSGSVGSASGSGSGSSSSGLFTIENTQSLEVPVSVAEYDAIGLESGLLAKLTTDAVDDKTWNGTITSISPTASDGYFTVMVQVISPVEELTAGISTEVDIVIDSRTGVYAVPFDAVATNASGQTVVYALDDTAAGETGQEDAPQTTGQPNGEGETPALNRTEIVVETGLETDYYIEISGSELRDGLVILNDPLGNTVQAQQANGASGGPESGLTFNMGGGMPSGGGGVPPVGGGGPP